MAEVRTLRLMWFCFVASIAVFQVVLVFAELPAERLDITSALAIGASAIGPAIFGLVGIPIVMRTTPAMTAFILRFACFETVALFGFVAGFSSGAVAISLSAAVVAWLLLLTVFPTDERYTSWEVRRLGDDL